MGGGIKTANNLLTTEKGYALDARQGKVLDEKITETSNKLSKMIQASGILQGNTDWDNYKTAGVYKVQYPAMTAEYHAPVGLYQYGILIVYVAETDGEHRTMQIYYPHNPEKHSNNIVMSIRMWNVSAWSKWCGVTGQVL